MRKILALLLALCMLCGCASRQTEPTAETLAQGEDPLMAAFEALWAAVYSGQELKTGFKNLSQPQKVFLALYYLDLEMANGGLCQFLCNDGGIFTPHISGYLQEVGATEHRKLFDSFCADNQIDTTDASQFAFSTVADYLALYEQYPFEAFDNAYYDLTPMTDFLERYLTEHPEILPE